MEAINFVQNCKVEDNLQNIKAAPATSATYDSTMGASFVLSLGCILSQTQGPPTPLQQFMPFWCLVI